MLTHADPNVLAQIFPAYIWIPCLVNSGASCVQVLLSMNVI